MLYTSIKELLGFLLRGQLFTSFAFLLLDYVCIIYLPTCNALNAVKISSGWYLVKPLLCSVVTGGKCMWARLCTAEMLNAQLHHLVLFIVCAQNRLVSLFPCDFKQFWSYNQRTAHSWQHMHTCTHAHAGSRGLLYCFRWHHGSSAV
jgi:hypothetical protein